MILEEYLYFFSALAVAVTFIHGLAFTFNEGEIFGKLGIWMKANFPEWVNQPLWLCEYCMSSVHGTWIFIVLLWGFPWFMWILFCFCLCGLTSILNK